MLSASGSMTVEAWFRRSGQEAPLRAVARQPGSGGSGWCGSLVAHVNAWTSPLSAQVPRGKECARIAKERIDIEGRKQIVVGLNLVASGRIEHSQRKGHAR